MTHAKRIISLIFLAGFLGWAVEASPKINVRVKPSLANIRESASISSRILTTAKMGTLLEVVEKTGQWYKIVLPGAGVQAFGYIHQSIVEEVPPSPSEPVAPPAEEAKPAPKEPPPPTLGTQPVRERTAGPASEPYKKIFMRLQYQMGFQEESLNLSMNRTVYHENARYGLDYKANKGNSIDAAFGFRFTRLFGAAVGISSTSRSLDEKTSVSIPHPLWLNSPRTGEAGASALNINAVDLYLNLVVFLEFWKFGIDIYGGPCYMLTKADVITDISFSEGNYPYSQITFTSTPASLKSNVIGFNAGASLGFNLGRSLAVYVDGRYVAGQGLYKSGTDLGDLAITLGGLKAGAGIKIMF